MDSGLINRLKLEEVFNSDPMFRVRPVRDDPIDAADLVETYSEAYENLANGIHEHVQSASTSDVGLLTKNVTPFAWINGKVAGTRTEYMINGQEPDFVTTYRDISRLVFRKLMNDTVESGDLTHPYNIIDTYKESDLARLFLADVYHEKKRYPDMVVGASYESVAARITARNNRTKQLKEAVKNHGKNQRHSELYRKLHHPDTGMLGALGILLALKTSYGARKYTDENYIQPVERIAQMPSLIEQLVEREKSGLSIASLDE